MGCADRMGAKYNAKRGIQMAEMIVQSHANTVGTFKKISHTDFSKEVYLWHFAVSLPPRIL